MYPDEFPIHAHLCCHKGNGIGMKRFGGEMREDLENSLES